MENCNRKSILSLAAHSHSEVSFWFLFLHLVFWTHASYQSASTILCCIRFFLFGFVTEEFFCVSQISWRCDTCIHSFSGWEPFPCWVLRALSSESGDTGVGIIWIVIGTAQGCELSSNFDLNLKAQFSLSCFLILNQSSHIGWFYCLFHLPWYGSKSLPLGVRASAG